MCDVSIKYDRKSIILLQYLYIHYDNTELRVTILFITILLYKVYYVDTCSQKWAYLV